MFSQVSVILFTGEGLCVFQHALGRHTPLVRHPLGKPPCPVHAGRLLQQTVRILLECILVVVAVVVLRVSKFTAFPARLN